MPIEMPKNFETLEDALAEVSKQLHAIDLFMKEEDAGRLPACLRGLVTASREYLYERPGDDRANVQLLIDRVREPQMDFSALDPYLSAGESADDVRDGILMLAEATLAIRAPFTPEVFAPRALDSMRANAEVIFYSALKDSDNPTDALYENMHKVFEGEDVPCYSILRNRQKLNKYIVDRKNSEPNFKQFHSVFGNFGAMAGYILVTAEKRMASVAPLRPRRQPIFSAPAA